MSLDITLKSTEPITKSGTGVFIRINGQNKELTKEEVKEKWPNHTPEESIYQTNEVYSANITHNLIYMAQEAGIYRELWRPEEIGIKKARELTKPLSQALHELKSNPERFKALNPKNGWGTYEGFVEFLYSLLETCYKYPEAEIESSR